MDNKESNKLPSQPIKQDDDLSLLSSMINAQLSNPDSRMSQIIKNKGKVHCLTWLLKQHKKSEI